MNAASFVLVVAVTSGPLAAQSLDDAKIRSLEGVVEREMEAQSLVGLSVAVGLDGELAWTCGFGLADLEQEVPATEHTVYRLASITKPVTAAAVLHLVDQGKIDLDAPVETYVSEWPEKRWPVTCRQLLGHLGGVRHYLDKDGWNNTKAYSTSTEALEWFADDPLIAEPGTRYQYSSFGFNLLGAVVEGASGMSFVEYLEEHIFPAAGTVALQNDAQARVIKHRAPGYQSNEGAITNSRLVDISYKVGGGGLCGTAADLVRFAHAMHAGDLVSEESLEQMWTRQRLTDGTETGYGFGWSVEVDDRGRKAVSHGGSQARVRTSLLYLVDRQIAVAVMCNSEWCDATRVVRQVARQVESQLAPANR